MHKRSVIIVGIFIIGILSHFVHAQSGNSQNVLDAIAKNNAALQQTYAKNKADNLARIQQQIEQLSPPVQTTSDAKAKPSYTFTPPPATPPPASQASQIPPSQVLDAPTYAPAATPQAAPLPADNPLPSQPNIFVAPTRPGPQPSRPESPGVIYR